MNMIIKKFDKMYGGYDYVEYDGKSNKYKKGNTRAHAGHWDDRAVHVEVATLRELKEFERQLKGNNVGLVLV